MPSDQSRVTQHENSLGKEDSMKPAYFAALFLGAFSFGAAIASEADREKVIAVAKVLAGGSIGEDAANDTLSKPVATRLLARGTLADKQCGLKGQGALAVLVYRTLGVNLDPNDENDKPLMVAAMLFAVSDFDDLGKRKWCADYIARAMPADTLFGRSQLLRCVSRTGDMRIKT